MLIEQIDSDPEVFGVKDIGLKDVNILD